MSESARPEQQHPQLVPGDGAAPQPVPPSGLGAGQVRKFADLVSAGHRAYPLPGTSDPAAASWGPWGAGAANPGTVARTAAPDETAAAALREERGHVHTIARLVGLAAFESMAGVRPVHQLARWLEAGQYEKMRCRVALVAAAQPDGGARVHRNTTIRRSRLCNVAVGAYEASLVVAENDRVRAAALRLERRHGHWTVVELLIG